MSHYYHCFHHHPLLTSFSCCCSSSVLLASSRAVSARWYVAVPPLGITAHQQSPSGGRPPPNCIIAMAPSVRKASAHTRAIHSKWALACHEPLPPPGCHTGIGVLCDAGMCATPRPGSDGPRIRAGRWGPGDHRAGSQGTGFKRGARICWSVEDTTSEARP